MAAHPEDIPDPRTAAEWEYKPQLPRERFDDTVGPNVTVIYDPENEDRWIQSTVFVDSPPDSTK